MDYFNNSGNEGHILAVLQNNSDRDFIINSGDSFMQGIIMQYFTVDDDNSDAERVGGYGSTGK